MIYLGLLVLSAALAAGMTKFVRDYANRMGWTFGRFLRAISTPFRFLAGVALQSSLRFLSFLYFTGLQSSLRFVHAPTVLVFFILFIPATGLFGVGSIDDLCGSARDLETDSADYRRSYSLF